MSRIYVASSWRNPYQPGIVDLLRMHGHKAYDFRNPPGKMVTVRRDAAYAVSARSHPADRRHGQRPPAPAFCA